VGCQRFDLFILFLLSILAPWIQAADYYVAPGAQSGNGSFESPWNLRAALGHPPEVQPGDTIWLRGGLYPGAFISKLAGAPSLPVILRQYPGERAVIDAASGRNVTTLRIEGSWTWYWGFEVTNSETTRVLSTPGSNPPVRRGNAIDPTFPF